MKTDKHWIRFGQIDPYLQTVRTLDPYKLRLEASAAGDPYFESGERYVSDLFDTITQYVAPQFRPRVAVDFGCSVGRIAIPLAKRTQSVVGLDVSKDSLKEAERNAQRLGTDNVVWLSSDDALSALKEPVDFFHSYNVLQHLTLERGLLIVRRALDRMAPGGVIAIHVPYADRASRVRRAINWTQAHIPGVNTLANIARGRRYDYPQMLMNKYDLPSILDLVERRGCPFVHCKFVDQGRYPGVIILARVPG